MKRFQPYLTGAIIIILLALAGWVGPMILDDEATGNVVRFMGLFLAILLTFIFFILYVGRTFHRKMPARIFRIVEMILIGGILGGEVARRLLVDHDWRTIFYFATALTAFFIPLFYFVVPESVHWLVRKQPAGALDKVNRTLRRLGHKSVTALPEITMEVRKKSFGDLFRPGLLSTTLIIMFAYFLQITTYYYILKWLPNVVVGMGFSPPKARIC